MSLKTAMSCFLGLVSKFFTRRRIILYALPLVAATLFLFKAKPAPLPQDAQIYQIHTPAFFKEKKLRTFDDFSAQEIKRIADYGFNVIWMTGIWQPSPASEEINLRQEDPKNPGRIANIFSIAGYQVNTRFGGEASFKRFVKRAQKQGLRIIVDFIPDHHGLDSPLLEQHPDWFFFETEPPAPEREKLFFRKEMPSGKIYWFRYAGDNHPWSDMIAFNYLNEAVWQYARTSLNQLVELTSGGGVRMDALGLLDAEAYRKKWFSGLSEEEYYKKLDEISRKVFGRPTHKFESPFKSLFEETARKYPGALLLGEVYDYHQKWIDHGTHLTYAKFIYDGILSEPKKAAKSLKDVFFKNSLDVQSDPFFFHQLYFLENHDENKRILEKLLGPLHKTKIDQDVVGYARVLTAAIATLPGVPMIYQGQEEGRQGEGANAFWVNQQTETANEETQKFYRQLFRLTAKPVFRRGAWAKVLSADGKEDDDIFAFVRIYDGKTALVTLNFSDKEKDAELDLSRFGISRKTFVRRLKPWERHIQFF